MKAGLLTVVLNEEGWCYHSTIQAADSAIQWQYTLEQLFTGYSKPHQSLLPVGLLYNRAN